MFGYNEKSSTLLLFFFLGILFALLSYGLSRRHQNRAGIWLSRLLFLWALYICPYMLGYAGWYGAHPYSDILFFLPLMQVYLFGPVVYFYVKSLLNPSYRLRSKDYYHFIPALLYFLYSLVVFVTDVLLLDAYYFYADGRDKDLSNWYQATGLVSMVIYLSLSLRFYQNYRKRIFESVSYAESIVFRWIAHFTLAFISILLLRVLFFILNPDWGEFGSQFWYYISFSFLFAYVAIAGYSHLVRSFTISEAGLRDFNVYGLSELSDSPSEASTPEKPSRESETAKQMSSAEIKTWKEIISTKMRAEKLHENPRLSLAELAEALGTNSRIISTVINRGFDMNFNDYINHHRIEALKQKIDQGELEHKTWLGLALECGFNSKATFNRAFKKSTQMSPKEYLENRISN